MATCKTCICYDPVHRWCVLNRERNPKDSACEWCREGEFAMLELSKNEPKEG